MVVTRASTSYRLCLIVLLISCFFVCLASIPPWLIESFLKWLIGHWRSYRWLSYLGFNDSSPDAAHQYLWSFHLRRHFILGSSARSLDDLDPLRASLISHLPPSYSPVLTSLQRPVCDLSGGWTFVRPDKVVSNIQIWHPLSNHLLVRPLRHP